MSTPGQLNPMDDARNIDRIPNEAIQPARHQLGDQQRPVPARQRVRVDVLDAIVIGAKAEVQSAEEDNRRRPAYEEARAERDELAAELARVYPPLAAQLADLLGRWAPSTCSGTPCSTYSALGEPAQEAVLRSHPVPTRPRLPHHAIVSDVLPEGLQVF
jgi:hypothetical protein